MPNGTKAKQIQLRSDRLREARDKAGLDRPEAVLRARQHGAKQLQVQNLKRAESSKGWYRQPPDDAKALAKVYGVDLGVLTGEKPMPAEAAFQEHYPAVNIPMPRTFHNALAVVCYHYGVSPETVLGNAPLLFASAAERSLQARRAALAQMREATAAVVSAPGLAHMGKVRVEGWDGDYYEDVDDSFAREDQSIEARDIIGEAWVESEERCPFTAFMAEEARSVGLSDRPLGDMAHPYTLLPASSEDGADAISKALRSLAGDDTEVSSAIEVADFIIPVKFWQVLRKAEPQKRLAALRGWMERDPFGSRKRKSHEESLEAMEAIDFSDLSEGVK